MITAIIDSSKKTYQALYVDGHLTAHIWGVITKVEPPKDSTGTYLVCINNIETFLHVDEVIDIALTKEAESEKETVGNRSQDTA